jgi:polygalacturonase
MSTLQTFALHVCLILIMALYGLQPVRAAEAAPKPYNVRDFGAAGDGKQLDSPAIDKAIEACAKAGGGTVLVPAGTYLSGSIHLKSNINLLIDAGATILGAPQKMGAYDPTEPYTLGGYQDGGHCFFQNSLIWGENLTHVSITGKGMIDGGGLVKDFDELDRMAGYKKSKSKDKTPSADFKPIRVGNKAISLKLCKDVQLRDFTIFHGGHFGILATGCENMTIDNLTIDTNRDGMDIDCCRDVVISNCRVNSPDDDGICMKSTHVLGKPVFTENVTVTNCYVSGFEEGTLLNGKKIPNKRAVGRIKFGTESSGGFRNCTVTKCTFDSCRGLALEEVDGGLLENIKVSDLTMKNISPYAIYVTTGRRNRTPNLTTQSRLKNVVISNVTIDGVSKTSGIQITGMPGQPLEGIRLENIRMTTNGGGTKEDATRKFPELEKDYPEPGPLGITPAWGVFARHVRGLELVNIQLKFKEVDLRPAAQFEDVQDLLLEKFDPQVIDGVPPVVYAESGKGKDSGTVSGVVVRDSPKVQAK